MNVRLIFQPETPIPLGFIPQIEMDHPTKKNEKVVPDVIIEPDANGALQFFFDVEYIVARRILERDGHCYKLWSPEQLQIVERGKNGAEMVTVQSVDPAFRRNPLVKKAIPTKQVKIVEEIASADLSPEEKIAKAAEV